ncbi:hypothetical protein J8273_3509 [Carpediemonas membranifera]|uniref:Uncharacterized protein n=1 Tax=Carpediemonas membranifera TaxID=201153 RepID=A0A8J6AT20_9EUKA|nr:hypothetical protein J8273_3509 [Carpediemonas membranifera]|eukprot:KAG9393373.1 hypothetical protein J8273_3509 [Carpediemonas membranifera]
MGGIRRIAYMCADSESLNRSAVQILLVGFYMFILLISCVYIIVDLTLRFSRRGRMNLRRAFAFRVRENFEVAAAFFITAFSFTRLSGIITSEQLRFNSTHVSLTTKIAMETLNTAAPCILLALWMLAALWAVAVAPAPTITVPRAVTLAIGRTKAPLIAGKLDPAQPSVLRLNRVLGLLLGGLVGLHLVVYACILAASIPIALWTDCIDLWWNGTEALLYFLASPMLAASLVYLVARLGAGRFRQVAVLIVVVALALFSVVVRAAESSIEILSLPFPSFLPLAAFNWAYDAIGCDLFMTSYLTLVEVLPLSMAIMAMTFLYGPDPHEEDLRLVQTKGEGSTSPLANGYTPLNDTSKFSRTTSIEAQMDLLISGVDIGDLI